MADLDVKSVVIPVAGGQNAFAPATKVTPRELLPIIDTPIIQFAIDEARAAGVERFIFVERMGSISGENPLRRYVTPDRQLEKYYESAKDPALATLLASNLPPESVFYAQQDGGPGLGRAIAAAEPYLDEDRPFAVLLPDDVIAATQKPVLAQMVDRYARHGGAMIAGIEVAREDVTRYGIMRIDDDGGDVVRVLGLEEKPKSGEMRSNFSITGRYILPPQIFSALENAETDESGALQLTDAIAMLIDALPVNGVRFEGERFDCGAPAGLIRAMLHFALQREPLRAEVLTQMRRSLDRVERDAEREARRASSFKPNLWGRRQ